MSVRSYLTCFPIFAILAREVACVPSNLTIPDLSDFNGPNLFEIGIPAGAVVGPVLSLLHFSGIKTAGRREDIVRFFCASRHQRQPVEVFMNQHIHLNLSKPLVLFVHGFVESYLRMPYLYIPPAIDEYFKYHDVNICIVDWTDWAFYDYFTVQYVKRREVGAYIVEFLLWLQARGLDFDKTTMISNSLGAHVIGYTGYLLKGRIGAIYALDPAGPFFCWPVLLPPSERLSTASAKYVQTIVTSSNGMGCPHPLGHQNFFVNYGLLPQAACVVERRELIHCSHYLSTKLFTFSLNPNLAYPASVVCPSLHAARKGQCRRDSDRLGVFAKRKKGSFWMKTAPQQPYFVVK